MQEDDFNRTADYEAFRYPWHRRVCRHLLGMEMRVIITRNGHRQVKQYCTECDRAIGGAIAYRTLEELDVDIDLLPTHADHQESGSICEACFGTAYVEYHHWAPWHLFGSEADDWPGSYLCPDCHRRWHQVVTPHMSQRSKAS